MYARKYAIKVCTFKLGRQSQKIEPQCLGMSKLPLYVCFLHGKTTTATTMLNSSTNTLKIKLLLNIFVCACILCVRLSGCQLVYVFYCIHMGVRLIVSFENNNYDFFVCFSIVYVHIYWFLSCDKSNDTSNNSNNNENTSIWTIIWLP